MQVTTRIVPERVSKFRSVCGNHLAQPCCLNNPLNRNKCNQAIRARVQIVCKGTESSQIRSNGPPPGLLPEPWIGSTDQLEALDSLRNRISIAAIELKVTEPAEETLKWYLRDRYFDVEEAEQKLKNMLKWRKEFQPGSITAADVAAELATGKSYVHEHNDIYGRPVIIIQASKHIIGEFPIDDSKRLCIFNIDTAIARLTKPSPAASVEESAVRGSSSTITQMTEAAAGQPLSVDTAMRPAIHPATSHQALLQETTAASTTGREQIVGIFNLGDFSVTRNMDLTFIGFLVEAFFEYYPRRVGQVLLVDAPWMFGPAWEIIKPLMRKYAALVRFVSAEEVCQEFFTKDTVPPEFKR
ncbi:hypothetical protein CEUSTIGMA_g6739.t1 [Chlamydomonas eustigma]|uniref:CRAL-TRIO domain-containing protein n=1 Tax=Chlamydomonas eustigma TaxID=1157962 RepID=A0A250X889_9CHLO|nr:hypothetical protein CEUSTIGMA_g6739.t1 [Chlamydomonas eustigma]|eukprot:GAX79298.1 hypothetical protein CEUSTIGMA_g6739.t1 [Chlamydomonas eustigma]